MVCTNLHILIFYEMTKNLRKPLIFKYEQENIILMTNYYYYDLYGASADLDGPTLPIFI